MQTPVSSHTMTPVPSKRRRHHRIGGHSQKIELLRIDPSDLAAQLMLYEHILYMRIRPRECLRWTKSQSGEEVKNLLAFCETHDRLATLVKSSILTIDGIMKRAGAIDFWIKVAEVSGFCCGLSCWIHN